MADIEILMPILRDVALQTLQNPGRVAFGTKEHSPVVVVDSSNAKSISAEEQRNFGPDETA